MNNNNRLGGGAKEPVELMTHGVVRLRVNESDAILEHQSVRADPDNGANHSRTFFRVIDTGKWQYCVRFPSGVIQILATEL